MKPPVCDANDLQQNSQEEQKNEPSLSQHTINLNGSNTLFRSTVAQTVAVLAINTAPLSLGMMIAFPTLAIGEIREENDEIRLNDEQASWFGSLLYLVEPGSNIMASFIQPYVGRKYGLMLAFIPQFISGISTPLFMSVSILYLSAICHGISAGFLSVPVFAYYGEITEPRIRGILAGSYYVTICFGMLIEFLLGSIFHWKLTAAINTIVPIIGIISISCIPDSPVWLFEKGKLEAAHRSLAWFRGWVSKNLVKSEFDDMACYVQNSKVVPETCSETNEADHSNTRILKEKIERSILSVFRPAMMRPLLLLGICHLGFHSASLNAMRCYLIEILTELRVPIKPKWLVFINSFLMMCGGIICMSVVKFVGKRKLLLISLTACSVICFILTGYAFFSDGVNFVWIPATVMCLLHLVMSVGIDPVPWMLATEVFPVRGRSVGVGLMLALHCTIGFIFSKTFYRLKSFIQLTGCFLLYGILGFVCLLYLLYNLPETEGKTLAHVESLFSKNSKKSELPEFKNTSTSN